VTELPTERRNIAQVFQFPVLYDTMTVRENLAFPLRTRRVPAADARRRVGQIAEMLDLQDKLDRRAAGLGAAEKQKIALGRGLVRSDVAAILFDEPLTVIDPHVKFELRRKLKQIHAELKLTLIYVTHDQNEALTFADNVLVMSNGEIVQVGTPEQLFERPAHTFVGYFIGSPGMNLFACRPESDGLHFDGGRIAAPERWLSSLPRSAQLKIGIRPHAVKLVSRRAAGALQGKVVDVEELGTHRIVELALGKTHIKARLRDDEPIPAEETGIMLPRLNTLVYANDRLVGTLDG
jgi:glycerol transport system ATP-binding protein